MGVDRDRATAFVDAYGAAWESWDIEGFVSLFTDDVVYAAHPADEIVVGGDALKRYVEKERIEQGAVSVLMGAALVDGNHVVGEFWVNAGSSDDPATIAGSFIARLDPGNGRCAHFREYWFDISGDVSPYPAWGQ